MIQKISKSLRCVWNFKIISDGITGWNLKYGAFIQSAFLSECCDTKMIASIISV